MATANMLVSIEETIGKHVYYLEGFTAHSAIFPPDATNLPINATPFKLKIVRINGEKFDHGIFVINNVMCKILRPSNNVFQVIPVQKISRPLTYWDNVYYWDFQKEEWIDAATTTDSLLEKYSEKTTIQTEYWLFLFSELKKFGFTDAFCRKLFRHMSWPEIEELISCLKFLTETNFSKARAERILSKANARKYISDCLGFDCKYVLGAKKALELYIAS